MTTFAARRRSPKSCEVILGGKNYVHEKNLRRENNYEEKEKLQKRKNTKEKNTKEKKHEVEKHGGEKQCEREERNATCSRHKIKE
jgi:hypothetical protein